MRHDDADVNGVRLHDVTLGEAPLIRGVLGGDAVAVAR
jgi:hypothetical protein